MSYKRQKRWWNAYILMYERIDDHQAETEKELAKSMQDLTIGTSSLSCLLVVKLAGIWCFGWDRDK